MKYSEVTPQQFSKWRRMLGMSQASVAKRLGISSSSVFSYEAGKRKEGPVKIPLLVALGMSAISNNLQPYSGDE